MDIDLENLILAVAYDGEYVDQDILRLHVLDKREGQGSGLAGLKIHIVAQSREVAQNTSVGGRIFREGLCG